MIASRRIAIPYFDGAEVDLDVEGDLTADEPAAAAALAAFLSLTPADRLADTRHVYAYYRDFHEAVGGEDFLDDEMGVPETPEAIWRHVHPKQLYLVRGPDDDHVYVVASGDCDWEVEHGLSLVWRDGRTLCKAGGEDGHVTNSYAYADDSLANVVYPAVDPKFRTLLTP